MPSQFSTMRNENFQLKLKIRPVNVMLLHWKQKARIGLRPAPESFIWLHQSRGQKRTANILVTRHGRSRVSFVFRILLQRSFKRCVINLRLVPLVSPYVPTPSRCHGSGLDVRVLLLYSYWRLFPLFSFRYSDWLADPHYGQGSRFGRKSFNPEVSHYGQT